MTETRAPDAPAIEAPAWSGEPFAQDADFGRSLDAYADAFLTLVVAAATAVAIALTVGGVWCVLPFVVPLPVLGRAWHLGAASSRRTKREFADHRSWRDAERRAVGAGFGSALGRRRWH